MTSERIILTIPRAKTEALFLQRVIQAAIQAYRNELREKNQRQLSALPDPVGELSISRS